MKHHDVTVQSSGGGYLYMLCATCDSLVADYLESPTVDVLTDIHKKHVEEQEPKMAPLAMVYLGGSTNSMQMMNFYEEHGGVGEFPKMQYRDILMAYGNGKFDVIKEGTNT